MRARAPPPDTAAERNLMLTISLSLNILVLVPVVAGLIGDASWTGTVNLTTSLIRISRFDVAAGVRLLCFSLVFRGAFGCSSASPHPVRPANRPSRQAKTER